MSLYFVSYFKNGNLNNLVSRPVSLPKLLLNRSKEGIDSTTLYML